MRIKLLLLLLVNAIFCLPAGAFEPIQQWKIFSGSSVYDGLKVTSKDAPGGTASAFCEDPQGNIWMGLSFKGVRMWDGKTLTDPKPPKESYVNGAEILSMTADSKGTLWIGTSEGLVKKEGSTWTNLPAEVTGIQAVREIVITPTDKVYISGFTSNGEAFTGGALAFYNGSGFTQFNAGNSAIPDTLIQNLTLDGKGHLWMTVGRNDMGLAKFDGKNWSLYNTQTGLPTDNITAVATNKTGKMFFGTSNSILEYDGTNWTTHPYSNDYGPKLTPLTTSGNLYPMSLHVAENGDTWIGFQNRGVYCSRAYADRLYDASNSLLPTNNVLQIEVDSKGEKWFLTGQRNFRWHKEFFEKNHSPYLLNSGGIVAFKENGKLADSKWTVYDDISFDERIGIPNVGTVSPAGELLFATPTGLAEVKESKFTMRAQFKSALMTEGFYRIHAAPEGKVYLSTSFHVRQANGNTITEFAKIPNMGGVLDMTTDANGTLWAAGSGGLSHWVNNDWETFNKKSGLPSIIVSTVFRDSKGAIWAGTQKGLVKGNGTTFTKIETEFPSDAIHTIAEDAKGRLWVGSGKGISILEGSTWTHISKVAEPKLNKFTVQSIAFDKAGNAWMGTELEGLLRFDGTTWTQYNQKNTGAIINNVVDVTITPGDVLYVISGLNSFQIQNAEPFMLSPSNSEDAAWQGYIKRGVAADPKKLLTIIRP